MTDELIALIFRAVPTVAAIEFVAKGGLAEALPYLGRCQEGTNKENSGLAESSACMKYKREQNSPTEQAHG